MPVEENLALVTGSSGPIGSVVRPRPQRILVVSSTRPPATALDLIKALREAGHELRVVSDWAHPGVDSLAVGAFDAAGWADREGFRPDALLFIEGGTRLVFPRGMEDLDCVTAFYALDPHLRH